MSATTVQSTEAGAPAFWTTAGHGPGGTDIHLHGELDVTTAPLLLQAVDHEAGGGRRIRLDLSALAFCDVVGIDALLDARRRLAAAGGELSLVGVRPFLRRVLGVCHAEHLLADGA